jgi:hypothetical protein
MQKRKIMLKKIIKLIFEQKFNSSSNTNSIEKNYNRENQNTNFLIKEFKDIKEFPLYLHNNTKQEFIVINHDKKVLRINLKIEAGKDDEYYINPSKKQIYLMEYYMNEQMINTILNNHFKSTSREQYYEFLKLYHSAVADLNSK